jgi:hypothetical protein
VRGSSISVGRPSNPGLWSRPHGIDAATAGLAEPETGHPVPTSRCAGLVRFDPTPSDTGSAGAGERTRAP